MRAASRALKGVLDGIDLCVAWSEDAACCRVTATSVSEWSVREHLEHLMLTDSAIVQVLEQIADGSWPEGERGRPNLVGRIIQWTGWIPRGKGRAPDKVIPGDMSEQEIASGFRNARERFARLGDQVPILIRSRTTQAHPALGHFTAKQWLRFVHIHHRHHQRIVREILAAPRPS